MPSFPQTDPLSIVALLNSCGEPLELDASSNEITYDATVGFTIRHGHVTFIGWLVSCQYQTTVNGVVTEELKHFSLQSESIPAELMLTGGRLECIVTIGPVNAMECTWKFPEISRANEFPDVAYQALSFMAGKTFLPATIYQGECRPLLRHNSPVRDASDTWKKGAFFYSCVAGYFDPGQRSIMRFVVTHKERLIESQVILTSTKPVVRGMHGSSNSLQVLSEVISHHAPPPARAHWRKNGVLVDLNAEMGSRLLSMVNGSFTTHALNLLNISPDDTGNYSCTVEAGSAVAVVTIEVIVDGPANVKLEAGSSLPFVGVNSTITFQCIATGFPTPKITLTFQPCTNSCLLTDMKPESNGGKWHTVASAKHIPSVISANGWKVVSQYTAVASQLGSGFLRCQATNNILNEASVSYCAKRVLVSDVALQDGFAVQMTPDAPYETEDVSLSCEVNNFEFVRATWEVRLENQTEFSSVRNESSFQLILKEDTYTTKWILTTPPMSVDVAGEYRCVVTMRSNPMEEKISRVIKLELRKISKPEFLKHVQDDPRETVVKYGSVLRLDCSATGAPPATYKWSKEREGPVNARSGIVLEQQGKFLSVSRATEDDADVYICTAMNWAGSATTSWHVTVNGTSQYHERKTQDFGTIFGATVGTIVGLLLVAGLVGLYIARKNRPAAEHGGHDEEETATLV